MKLFSGWFTRLIQAASSHQDFSVADPSAMGPSPVRTLALSKTTLEDGSAIVSLYWADSEVKVLEKKLTEPEADELVNQIAHDLSEVVSMTSARQYDKAKPVMQALLEKYQAITGKIVDTNQPPLTHTNAAGRFPPELGQPVEEYMGWNLFQRPDGTWMGTDVEISLTAPDVESLKARIDEVVRRYGSDRGLKMRKEAKIIFQNVFFDTPAEAEEYQKKMLALQPQQGQNQDNIPLWDKVKQEQGKGEPEEDMELAPPSISYEQMEQEQGDEAEDIEKRIEQEVKEQVESALEYKKATLFTDKDRELVEAMRGVGRTWEEISDYMKKTLKYSEDDTAMFIDEVRAKETGAPKEKTPAAPKPPENLVSPDTHDKLVDEVKHPEPEPALPKEEPKPPVEDIKPADKPAVEDISRADNSDIKKVALNPLQEPPALKGKPMAPPVVNQQPPEGIPEQDVIPQKEEITDQPEQGDRVFVMSDYIGGPSGFEGTLVSQYESKGDTYAIVETDNGESKEVPMHMIVKAMQKKAEAPMAPQPEVHKEEDLTLDARKNRDVIQLFISDQFPKDKRPVWGTQHLYITKENYGWSLVNYSTPILYRPNNEDVVYFNTDRYSVTTSKLQNYMRYDLQGENVKEVDEDGIRSAIAAQPTETPEPVVHEPQLEEPHKEPDVPVQPKMEDLHESFLKTEVNEIESLKSSIDVLTKLAELPEEHVCDTCGKPMGYQGFIHPTCPECIKKKHKKVTGADAPAPTQEQPKVPTELRDVKITPKEVDKEKAVPAGPELSEALSRLETVEGSLQAIERGKAEIKARFDAEMKKLEEQGGATALDAEKKALIDKIGVLIEAVESKTISYHSMLYHAVTEEKSAPARIDWQSIVTGLIERAPKLQAYVDHAVAAMKGLAKSFTQRTVRRWPKQKMSKKDIQADTDPVLTNLQAIHDDLMNALQLLSVE